MAAETEEEHSISIPKQIYLAVKTSNAWDLRKIFRTIGKEKTTRYLNEYWITEEEHRGNTFLHLSVYSDIAVCQYLLSEGANPNQFNLADNTPLHLAALQNRGIIVRLLIKYGADPSIKNLEGNTCFENTKQTAALIQKCIVEQETVSKLKSLPFQDPDGQQLKEIVSTLSDDSIIDDILELIMGQMNEEHFERDRASNSPSESLPDGAVESADDGAAESGVNRQDLINRWSSAFADSNITTLAQLSLPAFEDWPILVSVPAVVVYGLERVLEAKSTALMEEIKCFCAVSKVMDVLFTANHWLKNKFDDRLKDFEAMLMESGCYTLSQLQTMTSRKWKLLKIDLIFSDMVRKIINLYNVNCETTLRAEARKKRKVTRKKQDSCSLCKAPAESAVCCVAVDDTFIHIAFMNGVVRAFEFEIFGSFHEFVLFLDDEQTVHVPLFMQFLNDSNHKELVTADSTGTVCCWFLHSVHPNERAKCLRKWNTHSSNVSGFGIPPRSELVYTVGFDGYLRVRDLGFNGKIVHSVRYSNVALTALALLGPHRAVIGTENGTIIEVDIRREKISNLYALPSSEESPVRALCVDEEHHHLFFSFGAHSIGLIDIGDGGEWRFLGKFTEGFEYHQGAVNDLQLRAGYLWSSSEDNTVRIWDLSFLRENLENLGKKKGKHSASMPNSMKLADTQSLSANHHDAASSAEDTVTLLEVWSSLKLSGKWKNGIQRIHFNERSAMMIATAYQRDLIAYDLERIDNLLPQKQGLITQRRKQLNGLEQELQALLQKGTEPKETKTEKKKGKKKK